MKKKNNQTKLKTLIVYVVAALLLAIPIIVSYGMVCASWVYYILDVVPLWLTIIITACNLTLMTMLLICCIGDE